LRDGGATHPLESKGIDGRAKPGGTRGVWLDKAANLTFEQNCELLRAIGDLATRFDLQARSASSER
jgi:hypothetical protein